MTKLKTRLLAITFFLSPAAAMAELPTLTIHVSGAEPPTGRLEISVFDSEENFLKNPYIQRPCGPTEEGRCSIRIAALPDGEYAVVVVHDANGNSKLDTGFLGFGGERFAFSNNPRKPLFGRNSFEDAKFTLSESVEIEIELD